MLPIPVAAKVNGAEPSGTNGDIVVIYDATKCIGCRSCIRACQLANDLPVDRKVFKGIEYNMPEKLTDNNWTVIQVCRDNKKETATSGDKPNWSFMKRNCMHCSEPACAMACPVAALRKTNDGTVIYEESRCIGCRYCMLACPYHVPRYQWADRVPYVRKCNWCRKCVGACPVGALTQGKREDMIKQAHRRINDHPDRYVNHVYGEHEAGGACQLILAGMDHSKLGLPRLSSKRRSSYSETIMRGLPGWVVGLGLFLGGLYQMEHYRSKSRSNTVGSDDKE